MARLGQRFGIAVTAMTAPEGEAVAVLAAAVT